MVSGQKGFFSGYSRKEGIKSHLAFDAGCETILYAVASFKTSEHA